MSISHFMAEIRQLKHWFGYGGQLFWLRLRMLRLDVVEQIRSIILLISATLGACMVFFLGIISLLFALNCVLSLEAKIWTFSILTILFALIFLTLIIYMVKLWRLQGNFMDETLQAMQEDMGYLQEHRPAGERRHD